MDALVFALIETCTGIMVCAWMLCLLHLSKHERNDSLAWMFGLSHSSKHERNCGLDMDALVTACSSNMNGIIVWVRMLWLSHSLKNERNHGLGMDALVITLALTREAAGLFKTVRPR